MSALSDEGNQKGMNRRRTHLLPFRALASVGLVLLLLAVCTAPAAAIVETHFRDTYTFSATAPNDKMIDSFRCDELQDNSSQQYVLNAFGDYYTVNMNATKSWGTWTFNVQCAYPNGTVLDTSYTKFAPLSSTYDVLFQGYWCEGGFGWETQVFLTLTPLTVIDSSVWIPTPTAGIPIEYNAFTDYDPLAFYEVSGSSTALINDVTIYYVTAEEFAEHSNQNLIAGMVGGATSAVGSISEAAWTAAIAGIENIPGVGPYISICLEVAGLIVGEVFWWLKFLLIDNWMLTFLTIEFFILGEAVISGKSFMKMLKMVIKSHVSLFKFLIDIATKIINIVLDVAKTIGSLLPFT